MPEKILGLDISSNSIKAVRITAGLKGYEIADVSLIDIDETGGVEETLKRLFENDAFRNSVCVTSLPSGSFSFRNIRLPFKNRKKIDKTIAYELEPLLPYSADDILIDYTVVNQENQSEIFAAAIPESVVGDLVRRLDGCHMEASIIDIDAVPVVSRIIAGSDVGCGLLLDIGYRDTTAVLFRAGRVFHIRHFSFGGANITEALAEAAGIGFSEAEEKKKSGGTGGAGGKVSAACRKFFLEVKNTLEFLKLKEGLEKEPDRIFLTGGGALYQPLRDEMENFFSLPVEMVDVSTAEDIGMEEGITEGLNPMLINQALALATREAKKGVGFNFARERFKPKRVYEKFRKDFKWVAALAFIVLCTFGIDLYMDYHYSRARLDRLKSEITSVFKKTCPEVTRIVDPVQQLKVKIALSQQSSAGLNGTGFGTKTLDILKDISRLVPGTTDFLITSFTFDGGTVKIKGETDNFNSVDGIKSELGKSSCFRNVTISSASLIKKGNRVGFDLRMGIKIEGKKIRRLED
ncbi:MAG: pilus assembly protein PilM [Thermodesulfobacteriota bacterium]|nr:pilus assembly protein PilM [Thermodesulfobacteriota bacterium]